MYSAIFFWVLGCLLFATGVTPTIVQRSEPGSLGLNILANPSEAELDIVAVHGLDGHWRRSWTAENNGFWLQEFLPVQLPRARIYSFSYDSRKRGGEGPLTLDISDHGKSLVSDLTINRALTHTEQRPIIFIGHSLGGLVIKSALLHSDMARVGHLEEQKAIKLSTYAVLFLGTPHQGAQGVSIAQAVTNVISAFSHTNSKLLEEIKRNSNWLIDLQSRYNAISNDFKTVYYYETKEMPLPISGHLLVVPRFSAVVFGAVNAEDVALDADHSTMAKYATPKDPNFQKIVGRVVLFSRDSAVHVQKAWDHWLSSKETSITNRSHDDNRFNNEFSIGLPIKVDKNDQFTGRIRTLQLMDNMLRPVPPTDELHVGVIYGPGGVGKTQLALEYAHKHRSNYASIFWIDARRQDTLEISIEKSVEHIISHYRMKNLTNSPRFQVLEDCKHESATCVDTFLLWLAHEENNSWLIIIDNYDDLESFRLRGYLPNTPWGSLLITSRRSDLAISWNSIEVPAMEHEEALDLLQRTSLSDPSSDTNEWQSARELAKRLGYLPLALSQAGSYIYMELRLYRRPFSTYLERYQQYPKDILGEKAGKEGWDSKDDTILTTWEISFVAVQEIMPEASQMLLISGNLSPEGIPQGLFTFGGYFSGTSVIGPILFSLHNINIFGNYSELQVQKALGILLSFSFIRPSVHTDEFSLHPLIHLWARLRLTDDQQKPILRTTLVMLHGAIHRNAPTSYGGHNEHATHLYNIYTRSKAFACDNPEQHLNPSEVWDYSDVERLGNMFDLYHSDTVLHNVLSSARSIGKTLVEAFNLFNWSLRRYDEDDERLEISHWGNIGVYCMFERGLGDCTGGKDYEDLSAWIYCRCTRLFSPGDSLMLRLLFSYVSYASPSESREENGDYRSRMFAALLMLYGESISHHHPAVAGLHLGYGLVERNCPNQMDQLGKEDHEFNDRNAEMDKCVSENPGTSNRLGRLSRSLMSWFLATRLFCLNDRTAWPESSDTPYLDFHYVRSRSKSDPLSQAVLSGLAGRDESRIVPYMLLNLLDWKGPTSLRAWPSSLSFLAKHFWVLAGTTIGSSSAIRLAESWLHEHGDSPFKMECYHSERCEDGKPEWYPGPTDSFSTFCQVAEDCDHGEFRTDFTNEPSCQMGHLSSYLSMWHAGIGDAASAGLWLSKIYTPRPGMPQTQWHKPCGGASRVQKRRQIRLSFLDEEKDYRQSNYDTDQSFDYVAHVTVDILRGFHHRSVAQGLFSKDGLVDWPEISQLTARLVSQPSLIKAASLDDALAEYLTLSGRRPDDVLSQEERVFRAWDKYGKKCQGQVLRGILLDEHAILRRNFQGDSAKVCFADIRMWRECPTVSG